MTTRKIFASLILICFLIVLDNVVMASQSLDRSEDQHCIEQSFHNKRLVARDVIAQTIHDIQGLRRFIHDIPLLKSLPKTNRQLSELKDCVFGLVGNLTVARLTLARIRHLNDETIHHVLSNSNQLQGVMNEAIRVQGQVCHLALQDVDRTITTMLSRKLLDVAVTVDDIVYLVYQLQLQSSDTASAVLNP